jgi:hypothetical protein
MQIRMFSRSCPSRCSDWLRCRQVVAPKLLDGLQSILWILVFSADSPYTLCTGTPIAIYETPVHRYVLSQLRSFCFIPLHLQLLSALLLQADLQRSSLQSFPRSTQYLPDAPFHCITQVDYIHRRTKGVIEFAARHLVRGHVGS